YRIAYVPAIKRKTLLGIIKSVRPYYLRHAAVRSGEFPVCTVRLKVVRTAEIILGTRSAYGGKFAVAVYKELYFAFTPPAAAVASPRKVGTHVLSAPANVVKD